jgi:hypothetical protein
MAALKWRPGGAEKSLGVDLIVIIAAPDQGRSADTNFARE